MEVVSTMQNGGNSRGPVVAIYEECSFLCQNFAHVIFAHCPTEANSAAHDLAKIYEVNRGVWHGINLLA